jgi:(4S)-4-hydroxy-5-phosphonooxypentane-2,3-dione isomerase
VTDGFVILVEFDLHPGATEAFLRLVRENAATSVRDEPGCRRFDVLVPEGEASRIVLYEIYDDAAAFDAHLRAPHFRAFDDATKALVKDRAIRRFALGEHAKQG